MWHEKHCPKLGNIFRHGVVPSAGQPTICHFPPMARFTVQSFRCFSGTRRAVWPEMDRQNTKIVQNPPKGSANLEKNNKEKCMFVMFEA
jgi:hypothetical protein